MLFRASRLTPEARAVLDAVATIGAPIDDAVEECLAVGILRPTERVVVFRYGLRKTILESISAPGRRALHRCILEAMQDGPVEGRAPAP